MGAYPPATASACEAGTPAVVDATVVSTTGWDPWGVVVCSGAVVDGVAGLAVVATDDPDPTVESADASPVESLESPHEANNTTPIAAVGTSLRRVVVPPVRAGETLRNKRSLTCIDVPPWNVRDPMSRLSTFNRHHRRSRRLALHLLARYTTVNDIPTALKS